ncbi:hypothetical protein P9112_007573 [Eukaryota sp. TZLM1-RC]
MLPRTLPKRPQLKVPSQGLSVRDGPLVTLAELTESKPTNFSTVVYTLEVSVPRSTQGKDCVCLLSVVDKTHTSLTRSFMVNSFLNPTELVSSQILQYLSPGKVIVIRSAGLDVKHDSPQITINSFASKAISIYSPTDPSSPVTGTPPPVHFSSRIQEVCQWSVGWVAQQSGTLSPYEGRPFLCGRFLALSDDVLTMTFKQDLEVKSEITCIDNTNFKSTKLSLLPGKLLFKLSCLALGTVIRVKYYRIEPDSKEVNGNFKTTISMLHDLLAIYYGIPELSDSIITNLVVKETYSSESVPVGGVSVAVRHLSSAMNNLNFPTDTSSISLVAVKFKVDGIFPEKSKWRINVCNNCKSWFESGSCLSCSESLDTYPLHRLTLLGSCLVNPTVAQIIVLDVITPEIFEFIEGFCLADRLMAGNVALIGLAAGYRNPMNGQKILQLIKYYDICE